MRLITAAILLVLGMGVLHANNETDTATFELDSARKAEILQSFVSVYTDSVNGLFTYDTVGVIELGDGIASIDIPEGFKFMDGDQAEKVLREIWENPPSDNHSLGMLLPKEYGPADYYSWAINITYVKDGYISDDDAEDIDYDELADEMRSDDKEVNEQRKKMGYEPLYFIGWAKDPYYDSNTKKLYWAQELKFGDAELDKDEHTLNYNIRILGRNGYLMLNAIGLMGQIDEVDESLEPVLASVNFNEGHRYADFNPDIDEVAAYGVGALVAGKVLSKVGFFAVLAKFWKVIAIGAVAAFGAAKRFLFGGGTREA